MTKERMAFWTQGDEDHVLNKCCGTCASRKQSCKKSFARRSCNPCEIGKCKCSLKPDLERFWPKEGIKFVICKSEDVERGKQITLAFE